MFSPCRCNAEKRRSVRLARYTSLGRQDVGTTTEQVRLNVDARLRAFDQWHLA